MKKKWYLLILIVSFCLTLTVGYFFGQKQNIKIQNSTSPSPTLVFSPTPSTTNKSSPTTSASETTLPDSFLIANFPFQSQAPLANWDELHDEACEEASLILVNYFLNNQSLSAETMNEEILKMVDWEIKNWGGHKDLTIAETAQMAEGFYGLKNYQIKKNITISDIKKEISQNHPVIVPTAGRLLGNPYFRSPGPVYHMVVVIGYDENTIIVQDVGTRRGDHYRYSEQVFLNAIHDWNGDPDNIQTGPKNMLVFE